MGVRTRRKIPKENTVDTSELGDFLRTRRQVVQPEDVGLRRGARRRTSGLRREEVAALADVSADYLARLERANGSQPSEQVVTALARALRLSLDERDHLMLLAGYPRPTRLDADEHVSPGLLRILDSLSETPAQVMGPVGDTLAQNPAAVALFGDETHLRGSVRSAPFRWFTDPSARRLYRPQDHVHQSRVMVSQLRTVAAQMGPGSLAASLARDLRGCSDEFCDLWAAGHTGFRHSEEKHFIHPEVGELNLFCQAAQDTDRVQTLLVLTATPGTPSAERLRLLTVIGNYAL